MHKNSKPLKIKILSIDIGAGTQDILLYNENYETAYKLILPSPTIILANEIRSATGNGKNIVVTGETMGGGAITKSINDHVSGGFNVYMTERAARTVRDDLGRLKEKHIELVNEPESRSLIDGGCSHIVTGDINGKALKALLKSFGFELPPEYVSIGVEDHGVAQKSQHDRECRFDLFKEQIPGGIEQFSFTDPPEYYSRMRGVKRILEKNFPNSRHMIMDTKIAAMFGGYYGCDQKDLERAVTIDIGNGHTTIASIEGGRITGLFEHHTSMLSPDKLIRFLTGFLDGSLKNSDIFEDGGHGCYISSRPEKTHPISIDNIAILVTGPRRETIMDPGLNFNYVNPYGDTMITGNIGLTEAVKINWELK